MICTCVYCCLSVYGEDQLQARACRNEHWEGTDGLILNNNYPQTYPNENFNCRCSLTKPASTTASTVNVAITVLDARVCSTDCLERFVLVVNGTTKLDSCDYSNVFLSCIRIDDPDVLDAVNAAVVNSSTISVTVNNRYSNKPRDHGYFKIRITGN